MRFIVAAFGDPGHVFPAIALARELRVRGHEVLVESWDQWRRAVEGCDLEFRAAQEYTVFPPPGPDTPDGETAASAARALAALMEGYEPDLVVSDILTQAPTLAAEVAGVPLATLIPHVYPVQQSGQPMYSMGFRWPRTALGRVAWRATDPILSLGLRQGRAELNETRERLGLAPLERFHGGISELLALVATYPQLEYPRRWPAHVKVTGPMFFELPDEGEFEEPEGEEPLVVVAPSTSQDPSLTLLHFSLEALADEPVRVLATYNKHTSPKPIAVPDNAVLTRWLSYSKAMARADLVICHGGHGTVARALQAAAPVLAAPAVGDMGENAARVAWAGAGLALPRRLASARGIRLATARILSDRRYRERAEEIAAWGRANDGAENAAALVEEAARNETSRRQPARA